MKDKLKIFRGGGPVGGVDYSVVIVRSSERVFPINQSNGRIILRQWKHATLLVKLSASPLQVFLVGWIRPARSSCGTSDDYVVAEIELSRGEL